MSQPAKNLFDADRSEIQHRPGIVDVGALPELGVVPERMHAWVIRPERFGEPRESFVSEVMPTWELGPGEVLVKVMAARLNYNGVWPGLRNLEETMAELA